MTKRQATHLHRALVRAGFVAGPTVTEHGFTSTRLGFRGVVVVALTSEDGRTYAEHVHWRSRFDPILANVIGDAFDLVGVPSTRHRP